MTVVLPSPVADYITAKNRHDIEAMLAPFAEDARVHDEGEVLQGREAIRGWMEETTRKYRVTVAPERLTQEGGVSVTSATVSGDFPGSPARLTYCFTLAADRIAALSIS